MTGGRPRHRARETVRDGELVVIDCIDCGFRHLWPLPSHEQIADLYTTKFGSTVRAGFADRKRRDADHWHRVFARRLDILGTLLAPQKPWRILDVGCGVGDFLDHCRAAGHRVHGIEPGQAFQAGLAERRIPVEARLIEEIDTETWKRLGLFDVVTLSMVLEHLRDPALALHHAAACLRPGGILMVECPNDFNRLQMCAVRSTVSRKWWINPLHINYFDFPSLEALCRRTGLVPERRDTQFPLELFLLFGQNYVVEPRLGADAHAARVRFEAAVDDSGDGSLLKELYQAFAGLGIGRQAAVYARRPD